MCYPSRCRRFIVRKGAPGFKAMKMENKIGLRIVQNGDITLTDVFVPERDRLPGVKTFKDTNRVRTAHWAVRVLSEHPVIRYPHLEILFSSCQV